MSRNRIEWTAERRRAHARASLEGRRKRQRERAVRPAHVDAWLERGEVHELVRPFIEIRAQGVQQMLEDLGGRAETTEAQRAAIDGWFKVMVGVDLLFAVFAKRGALKALNQLPTLINTARAQLQLIGLERRQKPVQSLNSYLEEKYGDAPENAAGRDNGAARGLTVEVPTDPSSEGDSAERAEHDG